VGAAQTDRSEHHFYLRLFAVGFSALLLYLLWLIFRPFLSPIVWAVLLAFLLFPANRALQRRFKDRRGAAAGLMTLLVLVGVVVPGTLLGSLVLRQAADLLGKVSQITTRYQIQKPQDVFRIPAFDRALQWIDAKTPVSSAEVQSYVLNAARSTLEFLIAHLKGVVLGVVGLFASLLLMLFILYFFFRDGDHIARDFLASIPAPEDRKAKLVEYISQVTRAVVFGSLVTAIVQGTLVGIAFAVCGLASPAVFGVLAAIASLLPVGGTALVWVPGAITLASQGSWGWAIGLTAWGLLVVGTIDNLLRPALISGRAQISTLPVFFGVIGGVAAFGLVGLFLGPIIIALALAILEFTRDSNADLTGGSGSSPVAAGPAAREPSRP
jgi:predicted PurR-regulated permease PerM